MKNIRKALIGCLILFTFMGCQDFLDEKPNVGYTVPTSIDDLQALLDYTSRMNTRDAASGEISADDYAMTDDVWAALRSDHFKRMYVWEDDLFPPSYNEWNNLYQAVYVTNVVLDELNNLDDLPENPQYSNVKGQALVFRARSFLQVAFIWSMAYDNKTAKTDLGIPLRLSSNFNEESQRATVEETYRQIIDDLTVAAELLPEKNVTPYRPAKAAAYGYLARTYLFMGDYENALKYAELCLRINNELMNYNELDSTLNYPFSPLNVEVIMESYIPGGDPLHPNRGKIVPELLDLYEQNDLRRSLFFKEHPDGGYYFCGSYEGDMIMFSGIGTDEIYLISAESNARLGNTSGALDRLNTLLRNRYDLSFVALDISNQDQLINRILEERRKELVLRGLRWPDIKRQNVDGRNIILSRDLNGSLITLPPGDPRYALPLPNDILELSGMKDNPR